MSNEPGEEAPDAVMARVDMDIVRRRTVDEFICCIPTRDSQSAVWCEVIPYSCGRHRTGLPRAAPAALLGDFLPIMCRCS